MSVFLGVQKEFLDVNTPKTSISASTEFILLSYLFVIKCPYLAYICVSFHEKIPKGSQVMERTLTKVWTWPERIY